MTTMCNKLNNDAHFGSGWSQGNKRIVGLTMAIAAGLMFGASFNPAQYVIDNRYDGDDSSSSSAIGGNPALLN